MSIDKKESNRRKELTAILLAVALLGGAVWFWADVAKDRLIPKGWATVEDHCLYRSGQLSTALVRRTLVSHGIKVIVALAHDDPQDRDVQAEKKVAAQLGIELLRFPLAGDGTGDVNNYAGALASIIEAKRQGKPVLVHCIAGAQRTGGVIACYRLLVDKKPPAAVIQELQHHGWNPKRNPNLLPYLNKNLSAIAAILHNRGLLDDIPNPLPTLQAP
jgi:protein tyrosine/serine phosphatase